MSPPLIRSVHKQDFAEWSRMRLALYGDIDEVYEITEREGLVSSPFWGCFVVQDETCRLVGMLEMSLRSIVDGCISSPVAYIEGIYLDPSVRGRGWGKLLVDFAEDWGREKGCSEIATDCRLQDSGAEAFHRRMGFEEVERVIEFRKNLT